MKENRTLGLGAVLILLAGCAATPQAEEPSPDSAIASQPAASTAPSLPSGAAGTDIVAPEWKPGMWWTWRVGSAYTGSFETTTIVASSGAGGYRVGTADEATALRAIWFHVPPVGLVGRDLAWEAHDETVSILQFPLRDGAAWKGSLEGSEVSFSAGEQADGSFEVKGLYSKGGLAMRYLYDPEIGQMTNLTINYGSEDFPWSTLELVEAGDAWEGPIVVPTADDAFMRGYGLPDAPPSPGEFAVPAGTTHVMVGCLVEGQPGAYQLEVVPSQGSRFSCGSAWTQGASSMFVESAPAAQGTWRVEPLILGGGSLFTEIANVILEPVCQAQTFESPGC